MPLNDAPVLVWSYVRGDAARWVDDPGLAGARFVVEGEVAAPGTPAAPTGLTIEAAG
jgi:hypothetical protein